MKEGRKTASGVTSHQETDLVESHVFPKYSKTILEDTNNHMQDPTYM